MWELLTWQVPYYEYGPWQVVAMVTENAKRPEVRACAAAAACMAGSSVGSGQQNWSRAMHLLHLYWPLLTLPTSRPPTRHPTGAATGGAAHGPLQP